MFKNEYKKLKKVQKRWVGEIFWEPIIKKEVNIGENESQQIQLYSKDA